MAKVKLYPHPDARVGIPPEGEWYDAGDARRLVGQGIAVRRPPVASSAKRRKPASPAKEG